MLYRLGFVGDQAFGDGTVKLKAVPELPVPVPTVLPSVSRIAMVTSDEVLEELWTSAFTTGG